LGPSTTVNPASSASPGKVGLSIDVTIAAATPAWLSLAAAAWSSSGQHAGVCEPIVAGMTSAAAC
jgi:hypothetical protein